MTRGHALLPLDDQNACRARYRAMRPGWRTSGDQLEELVRSYVHPETQVMDLGCGRGGVVELFWRDVKVATGLDPDAPSLAEHHASGLPVIRGQQLPSSLDPGGARGALCCRPARVFIYWAI